MSLKDFKPVTLRGVTNTDGHVIGISFDAPDSVVRLQLPVNDARHLAEGVMDYLNGVKIQFDMSSGTSPSVSPQDGV